MVSKQALKMVGLSQLVSSLHAHPKSSPFLTYLHQDSDWMMSLSSSILTHAHLSIRTDRHFCFFQLSIRPLHTLASFCASTQHF